MKPVWRMAVSGAAGLLLANSLTAAARAQLANRRDRVILVPKAEKSLDARRDNFLILATSVTNDKDSGEGSLRAAILYANGHPGTRIRFPADEWLIIKPTSPLPPVTANGVVFEGPSGTVQTPSDSVFPPYFGPLAWIVGDKAGTGAVGLVVQGNNCTVHGLVITGFAHCQVSINGSGNKLQGCYCGATAPYRIGNELPPHTEEWGGYAPSGSFGGSEGLALRRSGVHGVSRILESEDSTVYVSATARNTLIGGTEAGTGNFIVHDDLTNAAGTGGAGIHVAGAAASGTTIRGNVFLCSGLAIVLETGSQRAPSITQVQPGGAVAVQGALSGAPGTAYAVDFYSNGRPVGSSNVTIGSAGAAALKAVLSIPNRSDQFLAATATNLKTGDTSALSSALPLGGASISGQVIVANDSSARLPGAGPPGWPGVLVILRQGAAVVTYMSTNDPVGRKQGGYYQFCHLAPGAYTISTNGGERLFIQPDSHTVTLGNSNVINVDFMGARVR